MAGEDDFRSEREFMDGLRELKARSGLSYRDIAARMVRTDARHAMARSTLAGLLGGKSLPRRPGQVAALVEVLAVELDEPDQTLRYRQAWSRLVAARTGAGPDAPAPAPLLPRAPADRPAESGRVRPPGPFGADTTTPSESPFGQAQLRALFLWLTLLTVLAMVLGATVPGVPFWLVWLATISPLPFAALVNWFGRRGRRHRAGLSGAPAEYLRAEYRSSRPA
ncbi:MAG TPA: hypothetical protein VFW65_15120 [Pseudonocardiaceae bacterium]|nr:hypothetical protein [Pseudonocardiaceae bacterium]